MRAILLTILLMSSVSARAAGINPNAIDTDPKYCKKVEKACRDAGYTVKKRTTPGKRLFLDCMKPLLDGHTVESVNIDTNIVRSCKMAGCCWPD